MNEKDLARQMVAQLDRSLAELSPQTIQKLQAARLAAVARYQPGALLWGHFRAGSVVHGFGFGHGLTARLIVPAAIVIASLTGLIYWQMSNLHEEELDTGLLAGELPIHAYIDPGFDTWLEHTSHRQQR